MKNVQLISAPADGLPLYEDGAFAPLGLMQLGEYLKKHEIDVEIIDGQHNTTNEIIKKISADVVGISFNYLSTKSLDQIVEATKNKGSIVVVGGQAATPLAKELLQNPNIDYVVKEDGEDALRLISTGEKPENIPNLVYRKNKGIKENKLKLLNYSDLPAFTWEIPGIEIQKYWNRFKKILTKVKTNHKHKKPLSSFNIKGCQYRIISKEGKKGCSFCSRIDYKIRARTPEQVYENFLYLKSLGADRIEEFSDSFLHNKKWVSELVNIIEKRGSIGIPIRVYADSRHINNETAMLAKLIGIDSAILGIESGNENILKLNGKNNTIENIVNSVELLSNNEIMISPSYVLGLIGETKESIYETFELNERLEQIGVLEMSYFSMLIPLPGSIAFDKLMLLDGMKNKHKGYHLNPEQLQRDFITHFTQLSEGGYDFIKKEMNDYLKTHLAQKDY